MDKYIGKRLEGRYEIQALIGTGGMANVYKALDVIDQRAVAVKILRDEYLGNVEFLRRFKNESKAISVLSHPNIVRVFDVSFTGKVHSIVMEYIDGITLKDYIQQQQPLGWKEAVHFTLEILKALQHAHDKGIVHRDIKPQNIMLLQSGTIKVTDFGIARFARSEVRTITDRAIGSVHYISPEQALGGVTNEKSDIYSVGVMLFEMLTGTLPFEAENPVSVAIKQVESQAVRPTSLNPAIPAGLEDIIMRAMEKDAENRYRSAGEMMSDIEKFKKDPSIQFEYKYLDHETDAAQNKKYRRAISQTRASEEAMEVVKRKRTPYIPILTGVTFAFVLASVGFIGLMVHLNNPFREVGEERAPSLVGISFGTAVIQYDGLFQIVQEEAPRPHPEYGKGVIYEQSPPPGRMVRIGGTINVKVSAGQEEINLPNFVGRDARETVSKLRELGLEVEERPQYSINVPERSVIYTDPSADAVLRAGDLVRVYVSMGAEERLVTVLNVTGMRPDDARSYLESNKLRLGEMTTEPSSTPEGIILSQSPDAGTLQPEDTPINIVVSSGPGEGGVEANKKRFNLPVPMPDINRLVTITLEQDGQEVSRDTLVPSQIEAWRPTVEGIGRSIMRVYLDGSLYWEVEMNFEEGRFTPLVDNRAEFTR